MLNVQAAFSALTDKGLSLPVVVLYVTEGCNFQCISCSYRSPLPDELSLTELEHLANELSQSGLRHIAFSGGEPLMRKDFPLICAAFARHGVKQTLLTNGILLLKRHREIFPYLDEIVVSLDGSKAETHDHLRGTRSFDQILKGIELTVGTNHAPRVSIRTVIQKGNFREIPEMIQLSQSLGVNRISFLTADILSDAFGRDTRGPVVQDDAIRLDESEVAEFRNQTEEVIEAFPTQFKSGFISQSPAKMLHLVEYYEALLGKRGFPRNRCNAPMISAVITSSCATPGRKSGAIPSSDAILASVPHTPAP